MLRTMIAIAVAVVTATAVDAAALPYLFERLKSPAYRKPLALLVQQPNLPAWIGGFLRTGNGVATPGETVVADGKNLELYAVCEPHNCAGNFLYVLYPPHGGRVWALVTKDDAVVGFLGKPSRDQQRALLQAKSQ